MAGWGFAAAGIVGPVHVLLIANPRASGVTDRVLDSVVARLTAVSDLDLRRTERPGHAVELARDATTEVVVALGGDGTANEVANGLADGVRMAVLPAGASSVFARHLGYSTDTVMAAGQLAQALAAGSTRPVGMGRMDGRRFTFAASVGFDAATMRDIDQARREDPSNVRPNDLHVLAAALREVAAERFLLRERMTIEAPGHPPIRSSYLVIANQHPYTYFGPVPVLATPRASFDTGLDAVAAGELRARDMWRLGVYALVWPRHASGRSSRIAYLHDVHELRVTCDQPTAVQVDGEYVADLAGMLFEYETPGVEVYVPVDGADRAGRDRCSPISFRPRWRP
jgi:diacylglycerol kinase family enzyme